MDKEIKKILGFAERGFTVVSLLFFSRGLLELILSGGASEGDGSPKLSSSSLMQFVFFLIYLVTIFLLVKSWKQVLNLLAKDKFILLLVGLAIISVFWSYAPELTLRRSMALVGTTLFGIYFGTRYSIKQQLQLLACTFGIAIILSLVFVLVFPEYGIMAGKHAGTWRGIFTHKNVFGQIMMLSSIVFWLLAVDARNNRFLFWFGFSISLIFLIISTSKNALISMVVILVGLCLYWTWQRRYELTIIALVAIGLLSTSTFAQINPYVSFSFNGNNQPNVVNIKPSSSEKKSVAPELEPNLAKMKRDSEKTQQEQDNKLQTLTNRTLLWSRLWPMIEKRLWLGYGYSAFWKRFGGEATSTWLTKWWQPGHAHNGWLELWLDLGLLGVVIFSLGFFLSFFRSLSVIAKGRTLEHFWPVLYLLCFVLVNLTESRLLKQHEIFWILYVAVAFSLLSWRENQKQIKEKIALSETD